MSKTVRWDQRFEPGGEWAAELQELQARRDAALAMGGPEALARFHASGRMDARARIAALVDPGSFHEMGTLAGKGHYDADGRFTRFAIRQGGAKPGAGETRVHRLAVGVGDGDTYGSGARRRVGLHPVRRQHNH